MDIYPWSLVHVAPNRKETTCTLGKIGVKTQTLSRNAEHSSNHRVAPDKTGNMLKLIMQLTSVEDQIVKSWIN